MLSQLSIALTVSLKTGPWTLLASRHKRIIHTAASQCSKRFFALSVRCCCQLAEAQVPPFHTPIAQGTLLIAMQN